MKGLVFVLCVGLAKAIYTCLWLANPRRQNRVDPEAVKHVRLTPEGSGWLFEYGWPKRKPRAHKPEE